MNRRSFLSSCLALAAAPAIVRADSLMRIVPRDRLVLAPALYDLSINERHIFFAEKWITESQLEANLRELRTMAGIVTPMKNTIHGRVGFWTPYTPHYA